MPSLDPKVQTFPLESSTFRSLLLYRPAHILHPAFMYRTAPLLINLLPSTQQAMAGVSAAGQRHRAFQRRDKDAFFCVRNGHGNITQKNSDDRLIMKLYKINH